MYLSHLSTELLTKIFEYCDIAELHNLQLTCKRFYGIIKEAINLGNVSPLLVTNQIGPDIRKRSLKLLTLHEKFFKLRNWKKGLYSEYYMLKERKNFMPRIVLTQNDLWMTKGCTIFQHKRNAISISLANTVTYNVPTSVGGDISSFIFKDNSIVTGQHDGSIFIKKYNGENTYIENAHESDIHSVDLLDDKIISGCKNGCLKMWNMETLKLCYCWQVGNDRIWSVAFSNGCKYIGIGTANYHCSPLFIYDANSCKELQELGKTFKKGTGLLQLKWESPSILLSCGYDGNVHKWDLRCNLAVQVWRDPFLTPVYCFDTDNFCTLVTGLSSNDRTVLWDMRMSSYVQMYFSQSRQCIGSPVYSLAFDVDHLFTAAADHLNVFNFSVTTGIARNYDKKVLPFLV